MHMQRTLFFCMFAVIVWSGAFGPSVAGASEWPLDNDPYLVAQSSGTAARGMSRQETKKRLRERYETLRREYQAEKYRRKKSGSLAPTEREIALEKNMQKAKHAYQESLRRKRLTTTAPTGTEASTSLSHEGWRQLRQRYGALKKAYEKEKYFRIKSGRKTPSAREQELYRKMMREKQQYEMVKKMYEQK